MISGKVLALGVQEPVPDVLVVAYDLDEQRLQQLRATTGPDAASQLPQGFWDMLQSDRLGSVLTDDRGRFELAFEDELFRRRDAGAPRPDLMLFVMAPEDTRPDSFVAQEPWQRIVHFSHAVRSGAGRKEAYVIRVPRERLDHFGIPYGPTARPSEPAELPVDPQRLVATLGRRLTASAAIEAHPTFQSLFGERRTLATVKAARARDVIKELTQRETPTATGPYAIRPEDRAHVQRSVLEQGLTRLRDRGLPLLIPLNENEAEELEAHPERAAELAERRGEAPDLVRIRSLLEACLARQQCTAVHAGNGSGRPPPAGPDGDGGAPGDGPAPLPPVEAGHTAVLSRVLGQINALEGYAPFTRAQRSDVDRLQQTLAALKLKSGPADVASFHDFHTLQIAFKSVWERVYGDGLYGDAAELYEHWVEVRKYCGLEEPTATALAEFRSLRDLVAAVERDLSAAAGLSNRTGTLPDWEGTPTDAPGGVGVHAVGARRGRRGSVRVRSPGGDSAAPRGRVVVRPPSDREGGVVVAPAGQPREDEPDHLLLRVQRLIEGLAARLSEPYAFDVFAPNTFNFGILVTYRQRWEPETYQAGELVATVPLAPGEKRSFTAKQVIKQSRAEKEIQNALSSHRGETSQTARADAQIVEKASTSTNFRQTAQGSFSLGGFAQLGSTTEFGVNQAQESEKRKGDFREAVRSAAEEYKRERTVEIQASTDQESETTRTGELANPNNEITVTYLFYELQRRYRISEQLHRARPVILVAQDVPSPDQIDEDWLLAHDWILRRVLLDDALRKPLDYLRDSIAGDELAVAVLRASWEQNLVAVDRIARQLEARGQLRDEVRTRVIELLQGVQEDTTGRDVAAAILSGGLSLFFGGGGGGASLEQAKEAANRELEFTDAEYAEVESRLRQAISALEHSTEKYVTALRDQLNRRVAVDQLRVHVKENILHYMQAIWSHEPSDQRFFRLYNQQVPWMGLERTASASVVREPPPSSTDLHDTGGLLRLLFTPGPDAARSFLRIPPLFRLMPQLRPLVEVAELDNLLGFKGNYMIFPLKAGNPLTDYMMQDYRRDELLGVLDPDESGNVTAKELEEVLHCVEHDEALTAEDRGRIRALLCERLLSTRRDAETVVVPTGQLFIEALPGSHAVLEDYKLFHRVLDVKKVEAEIRGVELENLRRADRLLSGEREDPEIDKLVRIEGGARVDVET